LLLLSALLLCGVVRRALTLLLASRIQWLQHPGSASAAQAGAADFFTK
jgi:hypothetical protein